MTLLRPTSVVLVLTLGFSLEASGGRLNRVQKIGAKSSSPPAEKSRPDVSSPVIGGEHRLGVVNGPKRLHDQTLPHKARLEALVEHLKWIVRARGQANQPISALKKEAREALAGIDAGLRSYRRDARARQPMQAVHRTLKQYKFEFHKRIGQDGFHKGNTLADRIAALGPGDVYMDGGAGQGVALAELLASLNERAPHVLATDLNPTQGLKNLKAKFGHKITTWFGDLTDVPTQFHNTATLVTDIYGPMTYSEHPDRVLMSYLTAARPGGRVLFNFKQGRWHKGGIVIIRPDGTIASMQEYLKAIKGIEIDEVVSIRQSNRATRELLDIAVALNERENRGKVPIPIGDFAVSIKKARNEIVVPELYPLYYENGDVPPRRIFLWP